MFDSILKLLSWLTDNLGTPAQRHMSRVMQFIRDASVRAAKRKDSSK